jgi:hypothetical protein
VEIPSDTPPPTHPHTQTRARARTHTLTHNTQDTHTHTLTHTRTRARVHTHARTHGRAHTLARARAHHEFLIVNAVLRLEKPSFARSASANPVNSLWSDIFDIPAANCYSCCCRLPQDPGLAGDCGRWRGMWKAAGAGGWQYKESGPSF